MAEPALAEEEATWLSRHNSGVQLGGFLAVASSRVLGQYDPFFTSPNGHPGRVMLVAPNVLRFERELGADPRDFHLWVALHELTHATQFAAAPWLADYLRESAQRLVTADDEGSTVDRLVHAARAVPDLFSEDGEATADVLGLLSPAQSQIVAELTATMSLLEGHADVIMDAVGPRVVKTIEQIRPRFDARRVARGRLERAMRRVAGLEAKTAQYVQGAEFVRGVLAEVGHEGFQRVWDGPESLPTPEELDHPAAWCARVVA
jgi:coenzyme F420 biosynthesis associated uncharacterized protein